MAVPLLMVMGMEGFYQIVSTQYYYGCINFLPNYNQFM